MSHKTCLMLKTTDNKTYFTSKRNYNQILDFANSFNHEISVVKLFEGEILDLQQLAESIAQGKVFKNPKFEILEVKRQKKKPRF